MKVSKLDVAINGLKWSGAVRVLRAVPAWRGMLVLNYHRIGDATATPHDSDVFSASQEGFARQIQYLARHFDIITPGEIERARKSRGGRFLMITFDDGYRDNYELAFPVLQQQAARATFFICTGFLDQPRLAWWDEIALILKTSDRPALERGSFLESNLSLAPADRAETVRAALAMYKRLAAEHTPAFLEHIRSHAAPGVLKADGSKMWMTWQMVRNMQTAGMEIGAHTVQHQLLARLSPEEQEIEIRDSRDRVATETGRVPTAFAYPVGSRTAFDERTKSLLIKYGFEYGFSFYGGQQSFPAFDPFDIRRAHVGHVTTDTMFQAMTTLPRAFARW